MVGRVGSVNGNAPRVLEVLFCSGGSFIFGLGDVQVDDALIIHLCHILCKFFLETPCCFELELTLVFVLINCFCCCFCFCLIYFYLQVLDLALPIILLTLHMHYLNVRNKGQLFW